MRNKILIGIAVFIAICVGYMTYTQYSQNAEKNRIEAETKAQNEQMIKKIDEHSKKGSPLVDRPKGTL